MSIIKTANPKTIQEAAELLSSGRLVAIPTETVYGLAANALDDKAVARIFDAKGRPSFNPLIMHCRDLSQTLDYVKLEGGVGREYSGGGSEEASHGINICELEEIVKTLAQAFWPGPLTLILPRKEDAGISDLATAGLDTIAVRIPAHAIAQKLLNSVDFPLVAPSANRSGTLSPTTPAHVAESLGENVDMILAAGQTDVGLESTVLDLSGETPMILRPGAITAEDIGAVLSMDIAYDYEPKGEPKSPGQLLKHYAPDIPVRLNAIDVKAGEALLAFGSDRFMALEGGGSASDLPEHMHRNLSVKGDLYEAASNLFAMLKELDNAGTKAIAVMNIPETGIGIAINDRLRRAAASSNQE